MLKCLLKANSGVILVMTRILNFKIPSLKPFYKESFRSSHTSSKPCVSIEEKKWSQWSALFPLG